MSKTRSGTVLVRRLREVLRRLNLPRSRNGQGPYDLLAEHLIRQGVPRLGQSNKTLCKEHIHRLIAETKPAPKARPARTTTTTQKAPQAISLNLYIGAIDPASPDFLQTTAWRQLRMLAIKRLGARCQCCGASPSDGTTVLNVDHIKPRKTHPMLALNIDNLQVLCNTCNHGKGNWDSTDWRVPQPRRPNFGEIKTLNHHTNQTRILLTKEQREAIKHSITCPRCNASPGMPCITTSGKAAPDHAPRWDALIKTHGRQTELGSWVGSPELLQQLIKLGTTTRPNADAPVRLVNTHALQGHDQAKNTEVTADFRPSYKQFTQQQTER